MPVSTLPKSKFVSETIRVGVFDYTYDMLIEQGFYPESVHVHEGCDPEDPLYRRLMKLGLKLETVEIDKYPLPPCMRGKPAIYMTTEGQNFSGLPGTDAIVREVGMFDDSDGRGECWAITVYGGSDHDFL
jgi:hypothetical protein